MVTHEFFGGRVKRKWALGYGHKNCGSGALHVGKKASWLMAWWSFCGSSRAGAGHGLDQQVENAANQRQEEPPLDKLVLM